LKVYADASFLISLYSLDANSAIAGQTMQASSGERYVTVFGELEVVNALHMRVFRKELSGTQAQSSLSNFERDMRDGFLLLRPLPEQALERAGELSEKSRFAWVPGLRTCYMLRQRWNSLRTTFIFDLQQRKLARAVGLKVN